MLSIKEFTGKYISRIKQMEHFRVRTRVLKLMIDTVLNESLGGGGVLWHHRDGAGGDLDLEVGVDEGWS